MQNCDSDKVLLSRTYWKLKRQQQKKSHWKWANVNHESYNNDLSRKKWYVLYQWHDCDGYTNCFLIELEVCSRRMELVLTTINLVKSLWLKRPDVLGRESTTVFLLTCQTVTLLLNNHAYIQISNALRLCQRIFLLQEMEVN